MLLLFIQILDIQKLINLEKMKQKTGEAEMEHGQKRVVNLNDSIHPFLHCNEPDLLTSWMHRFQRKNYVFMKAGSIDNYIVIKRIHYGFSKRAGDFFFNSMRSFSSNFVA